ncbi:MAG TPA: TonB-dependent receptor [Steroidobacteraceae bacterium]|jgi:iron complex outermembrane receptor protein|nr:TonB-dependent receptor [Steroidobacteraceae bacterium]
MRTNRAKSWLIKSTLIAPLAWTPAMLQAQEAAADAAATEEPEPETVIVTGTRATGIDEYSSSSPVQVLKAEELTSAGKPDLMSALANVVPSFTAQAFGGDMANQTLQAKMRGLSPNHTLVLVNGKRRHTTASLAILGGPYQGGAGVDLNFIPVDAIDHVEVLTEGAAAQYGTDAIAGVINIILKKSPSGGSVSYSHGGNYAGDGDTSNFSGNIGFEATGGSYINMAAEYRDHGHTDRGDIDPRVVDPGRIDPDEGGAFPDTNMPFAAGYPYLNRIFGDAAYDIKLVSVNAGVPIGDAAEVYASATWGDKHAASFENYRLPSRVSYLNPATGIREYLQPYGFNPREETEETDHAASLGVKGELGSWNWDVSTSYGKDDIDLFTRDSANASLFAATGQTPTNFHDGNYTNTQWTSNLDVTKEIEGVLAGDMNIAFGAEYRKETWVASPGDAASRYLEGGQSFPGISTSDSGSHDRDVTAAYVDFVVEPFEKLRLDLAGRYEDYSDFGGTTVGKLSARYEVTDTFALRGTVSTGFRAPTLAEEFYSATNVGPTTAFVQMPPNAPASALLGLGAGLQPEKSTNYSVGFVLRPENRMALTFDLYQVEVRNRIAATSTFYGTIDGELFSQSIVDAIVANGNVLDPEVTAEGDTGINLFTNGVTTRTRGAELSFDFASELGSAKVDWSIAATYNKTDVTSVRETPVELGSQPLFDLVALSDLTDTAPKFLVNLGARFEWERLTFSVNELVYGKSSEFENDGGACVALHSQTSSLCNPNQDDLTFFLTEIPVTAITNFEVSFKAMEALSVTVGATNAFDKMPPGRNATFRSIQFENGDNSAVAGRPSFSPFGINGAYYYGKLVYAF